MVLPLTEMGKQLVASLVMITPVYMLTQVVSASAVTTVGIVFVGAAVYILAIVRLSTRIRSNLLSLLPEGYQYERLF
jgi:sensor histidine kinase YesM